MEALCRQLGAAILRPVAARDIEEPRGRMVGTGGAVALPRNATEVAALMRLCAAHRVGVVALGGGTGLVGGQVVPDGPPPLILSLERMRAIRAVMAQEDALIAEAGATLAEVQAAAAGAGRLFPLSLASEGSCRIGGNLATNAGGTQVLRYGNARDLCLGLEAVLADGSILHGLKTLRKDNTGYDLRHLLIGSEGSLGIITAASLRLFPRPAASATAWLALPDPQRALVLFHQMRSALGEQISGFELMHRTGLDFLQRFLPAIRAPIDRGNWFVLLELSGPQHTQPEAALEAALTTALAADLITDGAIAQSHAQRAAFWSVRETIPEANRLRGAIASHDIALPIGAVPDFIAAAQDALERQVPGIVVNCFGHLGDGNLHYNLFPPGAEKRDTFEDQREGLSETIHTLVDARGGSISAEHGIGRFKRAALERFGDPTKLAAMRAVKAALDPLGILNPGAVLSREPASVSPGSSAGMGSAGESSAGATSAGETSAGDGSKKDRAPHPA
ncbi:MAG: FAD-binding oxidoreductase [Pseudomonadota bacterium]